MLSNFYLTHTKADTVNLFNSVVSSCGIPPTIIRISDIDDIYDIPVIDNEYISASMFLPPVDIFKLLIEPTPENIMMYDNEYIAYLNADIQLETISMIIRNSMDKFTMSQNMCPIIIEVPIDTFESSRLFLLLDFLYTRFGIAFNNNPHNLNFETLSNIFNMLYTFNLISTEEFLNNVPKLPNGNYNVFDINIDKVKRSMNNDSI